MPADQHTEAGRRYNQLPVGATGLHGLGNPQPGKPFVAGWGAFIHRQQSLVAGDQRHRGVDQRFLVHAVLPCFQCGWGTSGLVAVWRWILNIFAPINMLWRTARGENPSPPAAADYTHTSAGTA